MSFLLLSAFSGYGSHVTKWDKIWEIVFTVTCILVGVALVTIVCVSMIKRKAGIKPKETVIAPDCHLLCIDRDQTTSVEVYRDQPLILPFLTREGYEFCGWYLDSAHTIPFDQRRKVKKDTVLYAKWAKEG